MLCCDPLPRSWEGSYQGYRTSGPGPGEEGRRDTYLGGERSSLSQETWGNEESLQKEDFSGRTYRGTSCRAEVDGTLGAKVREITRVDSNPFRYSSRSGRVLTRVSVCPSAGVVQRVTERWNITRPL